VKEVVQLSAIGEKSERKQPIRKLISVEQKITQPFTIQGVPLKTADCNT
jgi:hypothetical protein